MKTVDRKNLYKRKRYAVFACQYCHQWQYSNMFQQTHKCVKCGKTLILSKIDLTHTTDERAQAIAFLQNLKWKNGLKEGTGEFITADKLLR